MNSESNSEVKRVSYSVRELAEMKLFGYPGTERAWLDRVKVEGWDVIELKGQGRGGIRREYTPPPEVQALIEARQRGEQPIAPVRQLATALPAHKIELNPASYSLSPGTVALFEHQAEVWGAPAIRLALIVRSKPLFSKASDIMLQRVSLLAFRFVFMFCDGDVKRINQWLSDMDKTDGLIKVAYEADCMKRGIAPGSDLNPDPNDPFNWFF